MSHPEQISISSRFVGPPDSGNGGYVGGAFAALLDTDSPVEVTLRSPVPLETPLDIKRGEGTVIVNGNMDKDILVAELLETELDMDVPTPPDWEEALSARPMSYSFGDQKNPLFVNREGFHPICFCCGAEHDEGLQVFAAPVLNNEQVAAIWSTKEEWAEDSGNLPNEFLWTALDCPGQFAYMANGIRTGMLGRITAQIFEPAKAGEEYMVTGWRIGIEGKKHFAGTALFNKDLCLVGFAKSVWIGRQD